MRVLHVSPYYEDAWAYGGIPRVVAAQARALAARGHEVTVCTTDACDRASRVARAPADGDDGRGGVRVRVFPNLSNRLAYDLQLFLPLGLGGWVDRHAHEFDVAHLHGCHHLPGAVAARRLRRAAVPYVLSPHGTAPRIERRRLAKYLFDVTVGRGVLGGARRVLAVSDAERRRLLALGVAAGTVVIVPNPVDPAELDGIERGLFRARNGLGSRTVVLFLGTLTPRKRVDVLVEAFDALGDAEARLVIAGNDLGAGGDLRRLVARRGLAPRTIFTGLLRGRERLEALADADVLVYPSRHEVFGLVPLEALLCGTPVIVADDSGCGEVIAGTGGGRVVREGDTTAVTVALAGMLSERDRWRTEAARAAERVRALYRPAVVCGALERVYGGGVAAPAAAGRP